MHREIFRTTLVIAIVLVLASACNKATDETAARQSSAEDTVAGQPVSGTDTARETVNEKCKLVPPKEPVACTMQYDPVCGCDGKTYANACMARAAGVPESTPGACEKERIE